MWDKGAVRGKRDKYTSLRDGLLILRALHERGQATAGELRALFGGRSLRSVYDLLRVLEEAGLVVRLARRKGWTLAYPHPFFTAQQEEPRPEFLRSLYGAAKRLYARTRLRTNVVLLTPRGIELKWSFGRQGQRVFADPLARNPFQEVAHASSLGQAILAYLEPEALRVHLARYPLKAFTTRTLSTPEALEARLKQIRREGFARSRGELDPSTCGLAVPLFSPEGRVLGALGVRMKNAPYCALEDPVPPGKQGCDRCPKTLPLLREALEEVGLNGHLR